MVFFPFDLKTKLLHIKSFKCFELREKVRIPCLMNRGKNGLACKRNRRTEPRAEATCRGSCNHATEMRKRCMCGLCVRRK